MAGRGILVLLDRTEQYPVRLVVTARPDRLGAIVATAMATPWAIKMATIMQSVTRMSVANGLILDNRRRGYGSREY